MSVYETIWNNEKFVLDIGGGWNDAFWNDPGPENAPRVIVPIWNTVDKFMDKVEGLPRNTASSERSEKIVVDKKILDISWSMSKRMKGVWIIFDDGARLNMTKVFLQPVRVVCAGMGWMVWFMNHWDEIADALLNNDSDEDVIENFPKDPRYLLRVCRKTQEIDDEMARNMTVRKVEQ